MKRNLLVLGACAMFLFTGCFSNVKKGESKAANISMKANTVEGLEINHYFTNNNEVIFTVKNTGKELVDYINIDVALYNNKGNLIRTEKQYVRNLNAGAESIVKIGLKEINENGNGELPAKVEFAANKVVYSSKYETVYTDKVTATIEKSENDGQLNLNVVNNSGVTLDDLSVAVVFYKDGKPVDLYAVNASNVEGSHSETVYVPTTVSKEKTEYLAYDEAKVVINNASKYNQQ